MEIKLLLSFIGASLILTIMPGPDNIFVFTESITKGRRNGIAISLGLCSGILIHTFAAATGLSIVIQKSALAFSIIKYIGAGYLFYLAIVASKEKRLFTGGDSVKMEKGFFSLMKKGFFMNVLNPKVSLFFIAFLPQFISKSGFDITFQMVILGLIFMIQAILVFVLISTLAGKLTGILNSEKFWKTTKWIKVIVLAGLGLTLAITKK